MVNSPEALILNVYTFNELTFHVSGIINYNMHFLNCNKLLVDKMPGFTELALLSCNVGLPWLPSPIPT